MDILVTGATGFVGNNVARQLVERGRAVRVLVREGSDPRPLEGLEVEIVHGDVCDAESVRRACGGVSAVIHSAAVVQIGWTGMERQRSVNVEGSRNVAKAALEAGARMVHVSSVDALGIGAPDNPADEESPREGKVPCPYVVTKRQAEEAVREVVEQGLHAAIVNPGFMFGPFDWKPSSGRMLLEVAGRFTPISASGGCSLCDARDVADGIIAAVDKGQSGRNYILAGHNLRYLDLWRMIAEVSGGSAPWFRVRTPGRVIGSWWGDLKTKLIGRESDFNSAAIRMSSLNHYYSSERAKTELRYRIRSAKETVEDAWRWFVDNGYVK